MLSAKNPREKLLIIKLWGGLGNQMFQYAFGLALSKQLQFCLKADISYYQNQPAQDTARSYDLHYYNLDLPLATSEELPSRKKTLYTRMAKLLGVKPALRIVCEKQFYTYDHKLLQSFDDKHSLYLEGYWQCPRYIEQIHDELKERFSLRTPLAPPHAAQAQTIMAQNSVAIHIRRGDYISNSYAAAVHNLCSLEYYMQAMKHIADKVDSAHFYIFSDDIQWCQQELPVPFPHTFVIPESDNPALGIHLMSLCKHHVIANSSYSWWGAWLAKNPKQIVIAPKQWLVDPETNKQTEGLIPDGWLRR